MTDIGLVQSSSLEEDLDGTVRLLQDRPPWSEAAVASAAKRLVAARYAAVVCDVSPLGVAAGRAAHLPTVLVESFTWDWIYAGYARECPELAEIGRALTPVFASASLVIETEPACQPWRGAVSVPPVSRLPRSDPAWVRDQLGVPRSAPMVLLTMGGIPWTHRNLERLQGHPDAFFVVPGASSTVGREGGLVHLPHRSPVYHPDLVQASDLVVGKLGYSTVAETYHAQVAFAYVPRPRFPETPILESFVRGTMTAHRISADELESMAWVDRLDLYWAARDTGPPRENGAQRAAALICEHACL